MPLLDRALGIHQHALPLRNARISTLASNIANADTPGYKAKDVDFKKAIKAHMGQGAMTVTNNKHFRHPSVNNGSFPTYFEKALNPSPEAAALSPRDQTSAGPPSFPATRPGIPLSS